MKQLIILGTRKSKLALAQAHLVKTLIEKKNPSVSVQLKKFVTEGDKIIDAPLHASGGKGLFVKELEEALLKYEIDAIVHSYKDVPYELPKGLQIQATLPREDARDCLISRVGKLDEMPEGAIIGTSSLRRKIQCEKYFETSHKKMVFKDCRGNVDTRISKLEKGEYDAILLATAGLKRLGLEDKITEILDPSIMIPSATQGVIAIETRTSDKRINEIVKTIHCSSTELISICEREFLKFHQASCNAPFACHALLKDKLMTVKAFIGTPDGSLVKTFSDESKVSSREDALNLGTKLAMRFNT